MKTVWFQVNEKGQTVGLPYLHQGSNLPAGYSWKEFELVEKQPKNKKNKS